MFSGSLGDDSSRARKQAAAGAYGVAAPGYDREPLRFFSIGARRLVKFAALEEASVVLDVATGTGGLALAAARAVGDGGRVVAIDLAEAMIERARDKASRAGFENVDFFVMDGDSPDFPGAAFDAVLSSCGVFFMPDMRATLGRWASLTRPGGVVAFSALGESSLQPMTDLFEDRIRNFGVPMSPRKRPFPWQRLTDPSSCGSLLDGAGLRDVAVASERHGYSLSGPDEWWDVVWNSGFRGLLDQLSPEGLEEFKRRHMKEIGAISRKGDLWLDIDLILARGMRAG